MPVIAISVLRNNWVVGERRRKKSTTRLFAAEQGIWWGTQPHNLASRVGVLPRENMALAVLKKGPIFGEELPLLARQHNKKNTDQV